MNNLLFLVILIPVGVELECYLLQLVLTGLDTPTQPLPTFKMPGWLTVIVNLPFGLYWLKSAE